MASDHRLGIASAFICLLILGVMPVLAVSRPAAFDSLTFTVWMTGWQIVVALPLFLRERAGGQRGLLGRVAPERRRRTIAVALLTGAMFGVSTFMYIVAAEKAGPVDMAIALQAYPLFAMLLEAIFLGKRKTPAELAFTGLMIAALYSLTTNGTLLPSAVSWWSVFSLGIPLIWATAHILLRLTMSATGATPSQITVSRLLVSGGFLLGLALVAGNPADLLAAARDPAFQKAAILLAVAYYLELIFWFHAIRRIDVSVASSITVPTPAVTLLLAVIVTGAPIATYQVLAIALIAAAMYGLLLAGRRRRTAG
ncbi:MAG TPA: DMT family transporter [Bauldia sp.]|nr:DMT family transporter [Bauldia sp.]